MLFIYGSNIAPFISIPIKWRHVDLSHPTDITKMKRQLLKQVHQQPAILYYDLKGSSQSFTNNYEQLDTTKMYLI